MKVTAIKAKDQKLVARKWWRGDDGYRTACKERRDDETVFQVEICEEGQLSCSYRDGWAVGKEPEQPKKSRSSWPFGYPVLMVKLGK